jgi:RHS repeat-associated protein
MIINSPTAKAKNYYTYSASGVKLRTEQRYDPNYTVTPSNATNPTNDGLADYKNTDYVGNIIYETVKRGSTITNKTRILVDGGYIEGSTYHYYLNDHLGNNRLIVNQNGVKTQWNHYYPFGMSFADKYDNGKSQPYKYNGKELDQMHGLNMYDYSARWKDDFRFTTVDPLAEEGYSWSPYVYCDNNPLRWIDPTGMKKGDPDDPYELPEVVVTATPRPSKINQSIAYMYMFFRIGYQVMMTSEATKWSYRENYNPPHFVNDFMITYEFITGTGPQKREFGPTNSSTLSLKKSHLTKVALAKIKILINGGQTKGIVGAGFNPLEKHDSGPISELIYDNFKYNSAQFVGSANYHFEVVGDKVNITVANETSLNSALYHIPFVGKPYRNETPLGIGGKVEQSYNFSISITELK